MRRRGPGVNRLHAAHPVGRRLWSARRLLAVALAAPIYASTGATAETVSPPYQPILLASKLGEMCSQCVAALACTPAEPGAAPPTIYLFPVKTVWQQILTIPTYLPFIGKPEIDGRPVIVHAPAASDVGVVGEAGLNFNAASLRVPGAVIDRRSGAWSAADAAVLGLCKPAGRTLAEARAALAGGGG